MPDVIYDVERASDLKKCSSKYYDKIYPWTNENMQLLFSNIDVKDKDVLTVLASSDQLFTSRYLSAKKVDAFDINKLTIYYFYLRTWVMKIFNEPYPSDKFLYLNDINIYILINGIKPESIDEEKAKRFWIDYLHNNKYKTNDELFQNILIKEKCIFKNDLSKVSSNKLNFYNFDILEEDIYEQIDNNKYDIVILSNILEYTNRFKHYHNIINNLNNILKDDGFVVCSHLINYKDFVGHKEELKIFDSCGKERELGYCYIKKK